jgi:transposase-like protein
MLIVETIAKVRRAYFAHGKSIKAICRELGLSRKVVRKVIRSGETSFTYERAVQPRPKLGQWTAALAPFRVLRKRMAELPLSTSVASDPRPTSRRYRQS